ncbi:MAG: bifunctional riboflavin kinase/FAD synthetase [Salinivirgaceae bacterium]
MKIYKDIKEISISNPVLAMGTFDGLHKGHRHVLDQLKATADKEGGESVVLTFWPHPQMVLGKGDIKLLNAIEEKIALFEQNGIKHLILLNFDNELAQQTYDNFVQEILVGQIGIKHLVFGYDHRFGHKGEGTFNNLKPLAKKHKFTLHQLHEVRAGHAISSTRIRTALTHGHVAEAAKMLGYNYQITGNIVHGQQLGRKIGFPTANIEVTCPYKLIPHVGVYACIADLGTKQWPTMMNIGYKPTVQNKNELFIEAHLIDFKGNIYDEQLTITFIRKIRDEVKFNSLKELSAQLGRDKQATIQMLKQDELL